MVIIGILSDTHITKSFDLNWTKRLISELKNVFNDVDEIIHAGDVCDEDFLKELIKIAPTRCVLGNMDAIPGLDLFIKFKVGQYNIGVIHEPPVDMEQFIKEKDLNILIHGHTHQPLIKGTPYNALIMSPGSTTRPKAPPPKPGFLKPQARPSVIKLKIDENDIISTYIINLKITL